MSRVLIVDDDIACARTLQLHLQSKDHEVSIRHDALSGIAAAELIQPEFVILDIRMEGRSGLEALPDIKAIDPPPHVIMITAFNDMHTTIKAMQLGAEDYIHKPIDADELDAAIERLLGNERTDNLVPVGEISVDRLQMVGRSRAMKEIFKTIGLVARNNASVMITGESGTGKELVAHAIHSASKNADGPFVVVNCAAVVETLLESDMFGHEKGSFTGATSRQMGKFELAENGTIFLDEVGEMSPTMQAKLLRAVQYKEFTPLGSREIRRTNARIVAATNIDLEQSVRDQKFREDLFFRLRVVSLHLPPLRDRMDDLDDLVQALMARINADLRGGITHIDHAVLDCFADYHWPGNIRELENELMKSVALSTGNVLGLEQLSEELRNKCTSSGSGVPTVVAAELCSLAEMEKQHLVRVLESTHWHRGEACRILGISRPRLRRMILDYDLSPSVSTHNPGEGRREEAG
jgi:DNA-binding NtrC family response regulator